ncbi:hypothetical protein TrLO_g5698 [Triparma laevis f. longispina]|uniref:Uncharacterized protein n=1 Tax=Triparma laevis f. longispina TaxID=1714387 RepID=A0A9W7DU61_9STRA|nr:hypothetical protein TrLO_g5698 [Triparma laevis f. longispina]
MVKEIEYAVSKGEWENVTSLLEKNEEPLVGSILSLTFSGYDFSGSVPPLNCLRHLFRHIPPYNRSKSFIDANADMVRRGLSTGFEFFQESFSSVSRTLKSVHTWLTTSLQTYDGTTASGVRLNFEKYEAWGLTLKEAARMYVQLDDVKSLISLSLVWPDENLISESKRASRYVTHTFQNSKSALYDLQPFMDSVIPNLPDSAPACLRLDYLVCLYGFKCGDLGDFVWPNAENVFVEFLDITEQFQDRVRTWKILECILVQVKKLYYSNTRNVVVTSLLENFEDFESLCHQTLSLEGGHTHRRLNLDSTITQLMEFLAGLGHVVDQGERKDGEAWRAKGYSDLDKYLEDPNREDNFESLSRSVKALGLQIVQEYEEKADEKLEEFKDYVGNLTTEITNTSNDSLGLGRVDLTSPNDLWNSRIRTPSIHNRERRYLLELRVDPLMSDNSLKKLHTLFSNFEEVDRKFDAFEESENTGLKLWAEVVERIKVNNKYRHDLVEDRSFIGREWKEKKSNLVLKLEEVWDTSVADVIDSTTKGIQETYADCVQDGIVFDRFVSLSYAGIDTLKSLLSEELVDLTFHDNFKNDVIDGEEIDEKQAALEEVRQRYDHANEVFEDLQDEDDIEEMIHDWISVNSEMTEALCRMERSAGISIEAEEWFNEVENFYLKVKTEVQSTVTKILKGIVETRLERFEEKRRVGKVKRLKWEKDWEEQINDMDETNESAYVEMAEELGALEKTPQGLEEFLQLEQESEPKVKFASKRCKKQVEQAETNQKKCEMELTEANNEFEFRVDAFLTAEKEEKLYEEALGEGGSVAETMEKSQEHMNKSVEKSLQGGLLIEAKYNLEVGQDKLKLAEDRLEFILDVRVHLLDRAIEFEKLKSHERYERELGVAKVMKAEAGREQAGKMAKIEDEMSLEKSWLTGECVRLEEMVKNAALTVVQEFTEERRNKFYEVGKEVSLQFKTFGPGTKIKQNSARYEMVDKKKSIDLEKINAELEEAQEDLKQAGIQQVKCAEIVDGVGRGGEEGAGWGTDFGADQGYEDMEVEDSGGEDDDDLDGDEWQQKVEAKLRRQTTAVPMNHNLRWTSAEEKEKARREKYNRENIERVKALEFLLEVEQIHGIALTDELSALFNKEEAEVKLKEIDSEFEVKNDAYEGTISFLEEKELALELFADDQWQKKFETSKKRESTKLKEAEEVKERGEERVFEAFKRANACDAVDVNSGSKVKCDGVTLYSLDVSNIPGGIAFALHVLQVNNEIIELDVKVNGRNQGGNSLRVISFLTKDVKDEGNVKVLFAIDGCSDVMTMAKYGETNLEFLLSGAPFADVHIKAVPSEELLLPFTFQFVDGCTDMPVFLTSVTVTYPDGSTGRDGGIDQDGNYTFGNLLFTMRDGPVKVEICRDGFRDRTLMFYKFGALRRKVKVMKVCLDPGEDEDEAMFNGSLYTSHRFMLTWSDVPRDMNIYVIRSDGVKVDFERKNLGANVGEYGGIKGEGKAPKRASMAHEVIIRNQAGHGPETISVLARTGMDYVIYVKNHSGEVPISESCALVEHNHTHGGFGYRVPKVLGEAGQVWVVCKIYGDGKIAELGELEEDEPEVINGAIITTGVWDHEGGE